MPALRRFRCVHCGGEATLGVNCESAPACSRCHAIFRVDSGIVALADTTDDRDYPEPLVDLVANVEGRHFWFAARNEVILSTMRRVVGPLEGLRLLDIGCGTGFVAAALEAAGLEVTGIDMHRAALAHARARVRGRLFSSSRTVLPFFRDFDIASLFDVIEHIDDDVGVLQQAGTVLRANGLVVITVPAGPELWTRYDEVIGHKRRYDRDTLADVLRKGGFEICYIGYFSCLPLLVQVAQRWLTPELRSASRDSTAIVRQALRLPPEPLNTLLRWSIRVETPLRSFRWVRGGSLLAIARLRV
jgi:SAM-dependent methyltransferase